MIRALHTAATGMHAQQLRMDITAHNLSNANTTGYRTSRAEFAEIFSQTMRTADGPDAQEGGRPNPVQVGLGVKTAATSRSNEQGSLINTSNPTDLAVEGDGFFRVIRSNGEFAYTRAGNFAVDSAGRLVTQSGAMVDPQIHVPLDATSISVQADGRIQAEISGRTDPLELGTIELALFQNPGGLLALGDSLFGTTAASGDPIIALPGQDGAGRIAQGYLEGSNVRIVNEMVDLITTQRTYEMMSKVIQAGDHMMQRLAR